MDHIGGLQGLIGLRWFTGAKDMLTIYGPPGTDAVVAGILQSLKPSEEIGLGVPVQTPTPEQQTRVVIVKDGSDLNVDGVRVRAVRNSHFDGPPGKPAENGSQSLSYRFDYNGYAIGFTGDTGPSEDVARLEKGADLLVSEVMDKPVMNELFMKNALDLPMKVKSAIVEHFNTQHLSPQEAGKIAEEAGVRRLAFTHLGIPGPTDAEAPKLISEAHETYKGEVIVAHDLDRF
jgi:ribonuclease BN (tRNA processing enzyme)